MGFWNVLFPENIKCIICNDELPEDNDFCLCDSCAKILPFMPSVDICLKCGAPNNSGNYCLNCKNTGRYFEEHRSVFSYSGQIINTIQSFKYSNAKFLATYLGNLLVDKFEKEGWSVDMIIPVPLHATREKERGYNQAYLLARQFEKLNIEVNTTALIRTKYLAQQAILSGKERLTNLKQSFKIVNKNEIKGKAILLIDDIFTTGNTINVCASTLLAGGVKAVYALTVCKTLLDENI